MNNKDFITLLGQKTGYTQADTQRLVDSVITEMTTRFDDGSSVSIPSFGLFEVKKRMERVAVNPSTGRKMLVPPRLVLNFRPVAAVKDVLKNARKGE